MRKYFSLVCIFLISACALRPAAVNEKKVQRQVCEAYCTYADRSGAIRRIFLTTMSVVGANGSGAWERLGNQCLEIQALPSKKYQNKKLMVVSPKFDGNNVQEFFEATEENACEIF